MAYSLYFPFMKSYWLSVFPFLSKNQGEQADANRVKRKYKPDTLNEEVTLNSVAKEEQKVIEDESLNIHCSGLRIVGI